MTETATPTHTGQIGTYLAPILGFAAVWSIRYSLYGSDTFFFLEGGHRQPNDPFSLAMLIAEFLTYLLIVGVSKSPRAREVMQRHPAMCSSIATGTVVAGLLVITTGVSSGMLPLQPAMAVGGALCGAGIAVLVVNWLVRFSTLPRRHIPISLAASIAAGSALMTTFLVIPYPVATIIGVAVIVAADIAFALLPTQGLSKNQDESRGQNQNRAQDQAQDQVQVQTQTQTQTQAKSQNQNQSPLLSL